MRFRIGMRLSAIWLVVAVPLSALLLVTYYQFYSTRVALVEQQRLGYARLSGESFRLLVEDMQRTMRAAGPEVARESASATGSVTALLSVAKPFPVANAVFADMSGRVVAGSKEGLVGTDLSGDPAFRAALTVRSGLGIEPSGVASGGVVGFHVAARFDSPPGRPAGVMLMLVDVRRLHDDFPVSVPLGGISVVDSAGQVVYQNEDPRLAERRSQWGDRFVFVHEALGGKAVTTRDFAFPLGGSRIGAFVPVESLGWAAGSSVDSAIALAPFYQGFRVGLPIVAALFVMALVFAVLSARGITRALGTLAADARRIGSGDMTVPVHTDRGDEIGDVAVSLERTRIDLDRFARENAELLRAEAEARQLADQELETARSLLKAARTLTAWADVEQLLHGLAAVIVESTSHTRAFAFLWDEGRHELRRAASAGVDTIPAGTTFSFDAVAEPTRRAITEGRTMLVDFDALSAEDRGTAVGATSSRLLLAVPLMSHGRLVGLIGVDDPAERREFAEREVGLIEAIASQAAVAIENAQLFEIERERARLSATLAEIDSTLHSTLDVSRVSRNVVETAARALGAHKSALGMLEGDGFALKYSFGLSAEERDAGLTPQQARFARLALSSDEPVFTEDIETDDRVDKETMRRFGSRSVIRQRLFVQGRPIGILGFDFPEPRLFSAPERDFVRRLGVDLSLALENAQLYASERDIAETLQSALLAIPEHIPGLEFAHAYRSATESARVGGDFYDLFELEHGLVGVTIGDISGHGIDAAVLTSLVKNTIRAQATESDKTPGDVVETANKVLYRSSGVELFATVFFGVLDLNGGRLVYCSAGHPAGARVRAKGGVETLEVNSSLIGAFADLEFADSEVHLDPGDVLFLFTDGLTEARGDGRQFGEQAVLDLLAEERGAGPQPIVTKVCDAVLDFAGGRLIDDLAILAIRLPDEERGADTRGEA